MTDNNRLIQPPQKSSRTGRIVIFTASALYAAAMLMPDAAPYLAAGSLLLVIIAFIISDLQAVHIALFTGASAVFLLALPALHNWPYTLLIPLLVYTAVVSFVPNLRSSVLWIKPGRLDATGILFIIATSLVSGIALYAWRLLLNPDLSIHLANIPRMPLWLLPLAGLCFSLFNAAMEEAAFRGIVMQALDSAAGPGRVSVTIQAALFGAMHYIKGFPNGEWGLAMTFIYGLMLGIIRRRSQGMLAPWLAHVCVDVVIFIILAGVAAGR